MRHIKEKSKKILWEKTEKNVHGENFEENLGICNA